MLGDGVHFHFGETIPATAQEESREHECELGRWVAALERRATTGPRAIEPSRVPRIPNEEPIAPR